MAQEHDEARDEALPVLGEAAPEELGEEEQVGDEGGLEDDGHVGGVEELDGDGALVRRRLAAGDGELDAEALEEDDEHEDDGCGGETKGWRYEGGGRTPWRCLSSRRSPDAPVASRLERLGLLVR